MFGRRQSIATFASWLLVIASVLLGGCLSSTTIDLQRENYAPAIEKGEAIAILGRRQNTGPEAEKGFIGCLGESLENAMEGVQVVPEQQFLDNLYPYFEPSTAPMNVERLDELVQTPGVSEKLDESQIRYIVWVEGSTERTDSKGSVSCTISPAGGGCFGFASWEGQADYRATVWDLETLRREGTIDASTSGSSYMPAIVIPIPILARTQTTACRRLAEQLKEFLG